MDGKVIPFVRPRRHARAPMASMAEAGRQSSAVTNPSVSTLIAAASGADIHVLPFRIRLMVDRSHDTPRARMRAAMSSSSRPRSDMNSESCMEPNVHQAHIEVKRECSPRSMEKHQIPVHHMHGMVPKRKNRSQPKPLWRPSNLRAWREHAGKTLEAVAPKMGLTHGQLSKIERGLQKWDQKVLETAALEYGCSLADLLERMPPEQRKGA